MSLYRVPTVVVDAAGEPLAGAEVVLRCLDAAGEAPVATVSQGGAELRSPLVTAADGGVPGWLGPGRYAATVRGERGTIVAGAKFQLGPAGAPAALPLCDGWSDYPGYAPSTYAGDPQRGIEVTGVIKASDEEGGCAGTAFARLPSGCRPERPVAVPAMLGVVTDRGVEVRVDTVVALPDGRLRAPNQPCRWLSLAAPITG